MKTQRKNAARQWLGAAGLLGAAVLFGAPASAAILYGTPDDGPEIIESAQAGDTVEIAPGTYQYRVYLNNAGTPENPTVIRAADPLNRPVWDLVGDEDHRVSTWPGTYNAGDRGRGAWQAGPNAAWVEVSGIVFRNCRDSSSAGFRAINSGPVLLRDCLFEHNTNGLTGTSEHLQVEFCEFRHNGQVWEGGAMTHNIYIYGGRFTMRYSFSHDSHEGQLFHLRSVQTLLAYNWFARPSSYVGDLMTCNYLCGGDPYEQYMTLMGNVILQGAPLNASQLLVLYHDEADPPSAMHLNLYHNTIIGTPREAGRTHALVNMRNDSVATHVTIRINLIYQVGSATRQESPATDNWTVTGANNWASTGANTDGLSATTWGDDPGFRGPVQGDFRLADDSPARGLAVSSTATLPAQEYYRDEDFAMHYRQRTAANDLGAFEWGTAGTVYGPYGPLSPGDDTDVPGDDTDVPGDDTDAPGADTDAPGDDTDVPGADTDAPGDDTDVPGADADVPGDDTDDDGDEGNASGDGCGCQVGSAPRGVTLLRLLLGGWG